MAKGLEALKVSLTKNGYFKVSEVIQRHPRDEVLDNLRGVHAGINLNRAQILNMLSGDEGTEELPEVWDKIRTYPPKAIEALTFISIIYSHKTLIEEFIKGKASEMRGVIRRVELSDKVYTNLAYTLDSLGFATLETGANELFYDLRSLFDLNIGPLAREVLALKLEKTGWVAPGADDYFLRDFYEQCEHFKFNQALGLSMDQFKDWLEGATVTREEPPLTSGYAVTNIESSASLITALAAKPFVIMAGPTGTGKTHVVRELAASLNPVPDTPDFNQAFVPVGAGWTDGRHLLGYQNPFGEGGGTYVSTPVIDLLLKANFRTYESVPFFLLLDEMNLSHVEMYFSKFLSIMETGREDEPEPVLNSLDLKLLYRTELSSPVKATMIESAIAAGGLFLSSNVFVIGTVNVDETTHSFSPKVLDRSFVIQNKPIRPSEVGDSFSVGLEDRLESSTDEVAKLLLSDSKAGVRTLDADLDLLFDLLGKFQFGPRVTKEVRVYSTIIGSLNNEFKLGSEFKNNTLDRVCVQKLLPKLHGNRDQVMPVIIKLSEFAEEKGLKETLTVLSKMKDDLSSIGFTNYFAAL